ncbi:predicted protein [Thalassiosira pseudonana CCMP1335]|uniref:Transcription factor CBF/NF-Y/archaeal histone domain-containing protein n=1 Tax=Thalassiosira pseudonana TaxID=35128 RepID=B8BTB1_THAPS|nr:predicted protein [Thalassiosira pseudonana CCMP1335]EED95062.1 predicted protein [Thalassiosira pseudonana CCMP1335]
MPEVSTTTWEQQQQPGNGEVSDNPTHHAQPAAATTAPSLDTSTVGNDGEDIPPTSTVAIPNDAASSVTAASGVGGVDWEPPMANIRRLLKQVLPKGTNISKDSVTALSRASGVFVLYLTSVASDVAKEGKRSTIAAKDVMNALKEIDLEEFVPQMEEFLNQHRDYEKVKKKIKDEKQQAASSGNGSKKGVRGADGKYVASGGGGGEEKGDGAEIATTTTTTVVVAADTATAAREEEEGVEKNVNATTLDGEVETNHPRDEDGDNEGEQPAKKLKLDSSNSKA